MLDKITYEGHVNALWPATFERHLVDGIVDYLVQDRILLLESAWTESRSHPLASDSVLLWIRLGRDTGMWS